MHELGIMMHIVSQMEDYMKENKLTKMGSLTIEVGEISGIVPSYLLDIYPMSIEGSLLEGAELIIEEVKAKGLCKKCHYVFDLVKHEGHCPKCTEKNYKILSGAEFNIKQITAY